MEIGTNLEKSPFLSPVKNIAALLLIDGILKSLGALLAMLFSPLSGIILLITGAGLIIVSFGLRRMRRWALYGYTFISLLSLAAMAYFSIAFRQFDSKTLVVTTLEILVLIYFWRISKKFQ